MLNSINDDIRNKLIDKKSIDQTIFNIQALDDNNFEEVIHLLLSDYYKIKIMKYLLNNNLDYLENLKTSINDMINTDFNDLVFLECVINGADQFNSLSHISKVKLFELFSKYNQDRNIMEISNLYLFDKLSYTFKCDLDSLKEYYKDFKLKENCFTEDQIITYIAEKVLKYSKTNLKEYKKLILNFISEYYKWTFFISNNMDKSSLYDDDYLYLSIIAFNSLDDIVKYSQENFEFLKRMIIDYLFYITSDKEISEPIVNDFYDKNVDKNIKNKLKKLR